MFEHFALALRSSVGANRRLLIGVFAVACAVAAAGAEPPGPRIVVGPNILVSRDGDIAHCETMIAANPTDPKNLLGGSIVMIRPDGGAANKAYVSSDGGSTWTDVTFPEEMEHGGADPQVGFGITGTAYFVGLSNGMNFYRSEDGRARPGASRSTGRNHDHEMLITDHTFGPLLGGSTSPTRATFRAPRRWRRPDGAEWWSFQVERDDGRSFIGPIEARGNNTGLRPRTCSL
jgi:hypothetical protein